jgi:hypothetical protein
MIDASISSARKYLKGLASATPIIVTIDQLPLNTPEDQREAKAAALDNYVDALFSRYLNETNIFVMPSMTHWHIGGNVHKALLLIKQHFPSVEFLYYMQHDFEFVRTVDHTALVNTMRTHPEVNYIRFKYKERETPFKCGEIAVENVTIIDIASYKADQNNESNDISTIWHTRKYSDNNHFARFDWYLTHAIGAMGDLKRPPEFPLQKLAVRECQTMGLYTFGRPKTWEPPVLRHLDGRLTVSSSNISDS